MATETLYVNGAGDECVLGAAGCSNCPNAYTCVDDKPGHDSDATRVINDSGVGLRDLFALENSGVGAGTINSVTVYAVIKGTHPDLKANISIKSGGVAANSGLKTVTGSYATYSNTWANPPEGGNWDWDKIDALQAGVVLYGGEIGKTTYTDSCTQVYVVVDYDPYVPPALAPKSATMGAKMIGEGLI